MKHFLLLLFFTGVFFSYSQDIKAPELGKVTEDEINMTVYEKDTTASAVVLYEWGNNYFGVIEEQGTTRIGLIKKYYKKIKILDKDAFNKATVKIHFVGILDSLEAITHNGNEQTKLNKNDIHKVNIDVRFTFPNVQVGSVLEYKYTIITPLTYNFVGWNFQSDIPKTYSEFNGTIFGNYVYNRSFIGKLKLDINESNTKKECLYLPGYPKAADCEVVKYAMKDIPAFVEEDYMLSTRNYISRLDFELSEIHRVDGTIENITSTWKDVDKEFRKDHGLGRQLKKANYFKNQIPTDVLEIQNPLEKAKAIYSFIKEHYTWNKRNGVFDNDNVKKSFENKVGNTTEINISLINALLAGELDAKLMLLATRDQPLTKKSHPVMTDFNYIVAKLTIEENTYLLDATEKDMPFGLLPKRALNYYGRVMDFKNDSYWHTIVPYDKNVLNVSVNSSIDSQGNVKDIVMINSTGYEAFEKREEIKEFPSIDDYILDLESNITDGEIINDKIENLNSVEDNLRERYLIEYKNDITQDNIYVFPFAIKRFKKNPFNLEKREYPIDFGYSRNYIYRYVLNVPENYDIIEFPESKALTNEEQSMIFNIKTTKINNSISLLLSLNIKSPIYSVEDYAVIKNLFNKYIDTLNNSVIILKKKTS